MEKILQGGYDVANGKKCVPEYMTRVSIRQGIEGGRLSRSLSVVKLQCRKRVTRTRSRMGRLISGFGLFTIGAKWVSQKKNDIVIEIPDLECCSIRHFCVTLRDLCGVGLLSSLSSLVLRGKGLIERRNWIPLAMDGWDTTTTSTVQKIPLLSTRAGPRDGEKWTQRRKEEFMALIKYMEMNKEKDNDWFRISPNQDGTKWKGKCWYVHNLLKYEFDLQFEIPVTYPVTAPELELPELDGKTAKMYRGGKICLTIHFKPLWSKNCPRFGIAHALCLGLGPWLAAEIPHLVDTGVIQHKEKEVTAASS